MSNPGANRPGLAKAGRLPLLGRRQVELVSVQDGPLRDLLEAADVVSEGMARAEGDALVYYGTTSLLLLRRAHGGLLPDAGLDALAALLRLHPHLRLRVVRVAHREALSRAGGRLATLRAEVTIATCARGLLIGVDVVADLLGTGERQVSG